MSNITNTGTDSGTTKALLVAGSRAGPLYVGIGTIEAIVREGFDISRHSLSLLANGSGGWVHSTMMVLTGLLTVLGVIGLSRILADDKPKWGIRGLAIYGLGVAASGLMRADPADGFPLGTPDGPAETVSWHGLGHLVAGGVGFLGLIVGCLIFSRWFRKRDKGGWALFSLVTGVYYLVSFAGIASGAGNTFINLAFTVAVILGWAWFTLLLNRPAGPGGTE
ncbi:MAG: DUF998 domain-containing protein [Acidimicrobiia bacterium]|nr:DUF998 domain-containing protein [Acidimicrobiia bacterium]